MKNKPVPAPAGPPHVACSCPMCCPAKHEINAALANPAGYTVAGETFSVCSEHHPRDPNCHLCNRPAPAVAAPAEGNPIDGFRHNGFNVYDLASHLYAREVEPFQGAKAFMAFVKAYIAEAGLQPVQPGASAVSGIQPEAAAHASTPPPADPGKKFSCSVCDYPLMSYLEAVDHAEKFRHAFNAGGRSENGISSSYGVDDFWEKWSYTSEAEAARERYYPDDYGGFARAFAEAYARYINDRS